MLRFTPRHSLHRKRIYHIILPMFLTESDTRAKLIDPALHPRGWTEGFIRREETAGTVEQLTTGVDVPCVRNIVFFKHIQVMDGIFGGGSCHAVLIRLEEAILTRQE